MLALAHPPSSLAPAGAGERVAAARAGVHAGVHAGMKRRWWPGPLWVWFGAPLVWLVATFVGLQAPDVWPMAWSVACGAFGVLAGLAAHAAWRTPRLGLGLSAVALSLCALAAVNGRALMRAQALWPAAMGPGVACALLRVDSLPLALPQGGWQLEANVAQWAVWAGRTQGCRAQRGPQETQGTPADQGGPEANSGEAAPAKPGRRSASARRARVPVLSADDVRGLSAVQRVRLYWPAGPMPRPGDAWWVKANWHRPDGAANPGGADAELLAWERGIGAVGRAGDAAADLRLDAPASAWSPYGWWDRWRADVRERITQTVSDPATAGVLAGLTVGDQSAVARDDWEVFRRTGVAHLMSISGSHIAVVGWWVAWLVRRHGGRSRRLAHLCPAPVAAMWLACLACTAYALLSGWGLPAQRTVWTMWGLTALRASGRDWPWALSSLWVMAWVALIDPWALMQAGFWLSFLCVVVLMAMGCPDELDGPAPAKAPSEGAGVPVERQSRPAAMGLAAWRELRALARVQVVLSLAIAPVAVVCFHQVSLAGVLVNLVAIPLFDLCITPLALLGIVLTDLWRLDAALIDAFLACLRWVASWPRAVWAWPAPPAWLGAWAVLAGLLWAWPGPRGWRWGWALAVLPLFCLPPRWHLLPAPPPGQFQALAIDVGQGTAVLVRSHGHALLFDTGPKMGDSLDAGSRHILPALQALGVTRLDALLISHEDNDHVGGAMSVLQGLPVTQLVSSLAADHPVRRWPAPQNGQPLPHVSCQGGLRWDWDGVRFEVLHPLGDQFEAGRAGQPGEPNTHSCVLKVSARAQGGSAPQSLLLTADIEADQEAALVAWARGQEASEASDASGSSPLKATVLMAPHHGSQTSSTPAFLREVSPRQVVVQAGTRNRYGHPAPAVIARYAEMGLPWVATPTCGAWWWQSGEPADAAQGATTAVNPHLGQCWRARSAHPWQAQPAAPPG